MFHYPATLWLCLIGTVRETTPHEIHETVFNGRHIYLCYIFRFFSHPLFDIHDRISCAIIITVNPPISKVYHGHSVKLQCVFLTMGSIYWTNADLPSVCHTLIVLFCIKTKTMFHNKTYLTYLQHGGHVTLFLFKTLIKNHFDTLL